MDRWGNRDFIGSHSVMPFGLLHFPPSIHLFVNVHDDCPRREQNQFVSSVIHSRNHVSADETYLLPTMTFISLNYMPILVSCKVDLSPSFFHLLLAFSDISFLYASSPNFSLSFFWVLRPICWPSVNRFFI